MVNVFTAYFAFSKISLSKFCNTDFPSFLTVYIYRCIIHIFNHLTVNHFLGHLFSYSFYHNKQTKSHKIPIKYVNHMWTMNTFWWCGGMVWQRNPIVFYYDLYKNSIMGKQIFLHLYLKEIPCV